MAVVLIILGVLAPLLVLLGVGSLINIARQKGDPTQAS